MIRGNSPWFACELFYIRLTVPVITTPQTPEGLVGFGVSFQASRERKGARLLTMISNGRGRSVQVIREAEPGSRGVLHVARKVAATVGSDYFAAITRHVSEAISADCVLIGEFLGGQLERVKVMAAHLDGDPLDFEYNLAGSATAPIALGKAVACKADAMSRYPEDALLRKVRAEVCAGVPLLDKAKHPVGALLALFRQPMASLRTVKALLEIFAERTAAELVREIEEERVRQSAQRYRAFIERNADAMWRVEFEQPIPTSIPEQEQLERIYQCGYVAECNDALARLFGRERAEQMIGCSIADLAPLSDPTIREATLQAIRSGYRFSTVETSPVDLNGDRRYMLRTQWGIVEDGMLERVWGSNRDITALKQSEEELNASEQRMADLLETMHLAVVIVNLDCEVAFCNRYLYTLTGWQPKSTLGKNWIEQMIPQEERANVRAALAGRTGLESSVHFESTVQGPTGNRWQFAWDSALLRDSLGKPAAIAHVGRDVTEHKALATQLEHADKLASIGRIAGGVAHDFNNLLTVIMGYSGALLEDLAPDDPSYGALTQIHRAAQKGAGLTQGLLAFSRRQVLRPEVVNVNELIMDMEGLLRRLIGEHIQMRVLLDNELGLVRVDAGQFGQVLMNLAANARDAMPEGGTLTIQTANAGLLGAGGSKSAGAPGGFVEVSVSDTGTGISEEVRTHIFEPFFTTKEHGKGTGLGLSMVYGIVQQSGGHIDLRTMPGLGTSFRILLPQVQAGAASTETAATCPMRGGTETILLVEDQEEVRAITAKLLRGFGYTVWECDSSARALEQAHDPERTIHLLITDVVMPGGGGLELADIMRASRNELRVLFISGYTNGADVAGRLSKPSFGYLAKPFTPAKLAAVVRNILDRP